MPVNTTSSNANLQARQKQAVAGQKPTKRIFQTKKADAKRRKIPFTLIYETMDWPSECPLLGIRLDYGMGAKGSAKPNSPSFDRIDPTLGYHPDNVRITSNRANVLKNNGTVDEMMRLACSLKQLEEYG